MDDLAAGNEVDLTGVGFGLENSLDGYDQTSHNTQIGQTNLATNTLTLENHGLYNGQLVQYSAGNGMAIGGLTEGAYYFALVKDDNRIQLAQTRDNVDNEVVLPLTSAGTGDNHHLTFLQNTTRFDPRQQVNSDKNTVSIPGHGFQTGDAVVYNTDASFDLPTAAFFNQTFEPDTPVNLNTNTIAIPSSTITTGDAIIYQSTYALDADSASNTAIGGLVSGTQYYAIKTDDGIQLAASKADALNGLAINLTSAGTGNIHTLVREGQDQILIDDHEIYGLTNTETYFVSVIDENTFRLTTTRQEAVNAEFIPFNNRNFGEGHRLERADQDTVQGIAISADLRGRDRAYGKAPARSTPKLRNYINNPDLLAGGIATAIGSGGKYNLLDQSTASSTLSSKDNGGPFKPIQGTNRFSIGLGVGVNSVDRIVKATVGREGGQTNTTDLASDQDISITSTINQRVQTRGSGRTGKAEDGLALGLGIAVGVINNSYEAIVNSSARLNARQAIDVKSDVTYPFLFDTTNLSSLAETEESDLTVRLDENDQIENSFGVGELIAVDALLGSDFLLLSKFTNTFVVVKNTGKIKEGQIRGGNLGFAGSIAINDYNNISNAIIRSGAQINQNASYRGNPNQSVSVNASTDIILVGLIGQFHIDTAIDQVASKLGGKKGALRKGSNGKRSFSEFTLQSFFNPWGNTAQNGLGASVFAELLNNTTTAKIESGARVHTGNSGSGLDVTANEKVIVVSLTQAGSQVEALGISGAGAGFEHFSQTIAQIEAGTVIEGGPLTVDAQSDAILVNAALALTRSKNIGVGLSAAINHGNRQVKAIIGDKKIDGDSAPPVNPHRPTTVINVVGDVTVNAQITGAVVSSALGLTTAFSTGSSGSSSGGSGSGSGGGTTTTSAETNTEEPSRLNQLFNQAKQFENKVGKQFLEVIKRISPKRRSFALGINGGAAVNLQDDGAEAYIYDRNGNGSLTVQQGGDINVNSGNHTLNLALAGLLTVAATSRDDSSSTPSTPGNGGGIPLTPITPGSGGNNQTPNTPGIGGDNQNAVSLGVGAGVNVINHQTRSFAEGFDVSANDISIHAEKDGEKGSRSLALSITPTISASGSGEGTVGVAVSGAVSVNVINHQTESYLANGEVDSDGDVRVSSLDSSHQLAVGGALALTVLTSDSHYKGGATLGIGVGLNVVSSSTQSHISDNTTLNLTSVEAHGRSIGVTATSDLETLALSIAGSAAVNASRSNGSEPGVAVAASAAVSINVINQNIAEAYIRDSLITANESALNVRAENNSSTRAIGGALSLAVAVRQAKPISISVGISAGVNVANNTATRAYIDHSIIRARDIDVVAVSTESTGVYSVVGALGASTTGTPGSRGSFTGAFALAGAVAVNVLHQEVEAEIRNTSSIHTDSVDVIAHDFTDTEAVAIGVSITAAVDVSSSTNAASANGAIAVAVNDLTHGEGIHTDPTVGERSNNIRAAVSHSTLDRRNVHRGVDVNVEAKSKPTVRTANVAGSIAVGVTTQGKIGVGLGVGISVSHTNLSRSVTADINQGSTIRNAGTVDVRALLGREDAEDAPTLETIGGSAALAGAFGRTAGIAIAIAAATATNSVNDNTVRAAIGNATVNASGDITVDADFAPSIQATNFGVAVGAGGGGRIGVQLSGAGIGSYNDLAGNTTEALIANNANVTTSGGSVQITADDQARIRAHGGTGSLAAGGGGNVGVNGTVGASVAVNRIGSKLVEGNEGLQEQEDANILRASINHATVTARNDVTLAATADSHIDALNISVALAAGGGGTAGISLAGAGVGSYNVMGKVVDNATVTSQAGAVGLTADDTSRINADGGAVSLAIAGGGTTGVSGALAAAIATNSVNDNTVRAAIRHLQKRKN